LFIGSALFILFDIIFSFYHLIVIFLNCELTARRPMAVVLI
jgi:hypothetical protein